jgi:hypothetical protein
MGLGGIREAIGGENGVGKASAGAGSNGRGDGGRKRGNDCEDFPDLGRVEGSEVD